MDSIIIKPKNEILKKYIEYFLFFKKSNEAFINYTTLPNNNLCLAIYKENHINYLRDSSNNHCTINKGKKSFSTQFYGFHKMPFTVNINTCLDQVCILFYPSALSAFTKESYTNLITADNFFDIFSTKDFTLLEQVFEEEDYEKRTQILEKVLLANLKFEIPQSVDEAIQLVNQFENENLSVEKLAQKLRISTSTLYRLFKNYIGQNPKSYLKTIRFRKALDGILHSQESFTHLTYLNQYYDQSHFIHDFKKFSGYTPQELSAKLSVEQEDLVWIYGK